LRVRPATPADIAGIASILNAEIESGTASWKTEPIGREAMADWYFDRISNDYPVLVATSDADDAAPVGYASFGPFRSGGGYAPTVEHSVYVARTVRRQGIARLLMEALVAQARAGGLSRMVGGVSGDQDASLTFHEQIGFSACGRLPGIGLKHGKRLDLVLMVLALD
jgi:phosphinothricin acetyltransferase